MPNDIFVILEDENYENAARPLHFPDWTAQRARRRLWRLLDDED